MDSLKYILVGFLLMLHLHSNAQETDVISVSDVEVVKAFEAQLEEAKMIGTKPVIDNPTPPTPTYDYNINIIPLDLDYPDPVIRPLAFHPVEPSEPKVFYLKAGFGNLKRPYVDLGYNLYLEDLYSISLFGNYHGGVFEDQFFALNHHIYDINLEGWYKLSDRLEVFSAVDYLNENRSINEDTITNRTFGSFGYLGGVRSNAKFNDAFDYSLGIKLNRNTLKSDEEDNAETVLGFPLDLAYHYGSNQIINLHNTFENTSSDSYQNGFINDFNLNLKTKLKKMDLDFGISALSANDTTYFFPNTLITYSNEKQNTSIFLGSNQKYTRNNLQGLYDLNPYFYNVNVANNTRVRQSIFIGAETRISKYDLSIKGGYRILKNETGFEIKNLPIGSDPGLDFTAFYSDGSAVFVEAGFKSQLTDWLNVGLTAEKLFYDLDSELGLPEWRLNSFARFKFNDKIHIKTSFNYISTASILVENADFVELNSLTDLSIEADYFFLENAGIYLALNNVLNTQYRRWFNYPGYGFNLYGGVKLKF